MLSVASSSQRLYTRPSSFFCSEIIVMHSSGTPSGIVSLFWRRDPNAQSAYWENLSHPAILNSFHPEHKTQCLSRVMKFHTISWVLLNICYYLWTHDSWMYCISITDKTLSGHVAGFRPRLSHFFFWDNGKTSSDFENEPVSKAKQINTPFTFLRIYLDA